MAILVVVVCGQCREKEFLPQYLEADWKSRKLQQ
jgi:hypothetical protein